MGSLMLPFLKILTGPATNKLEHNTFFKFFILSPPVIFDFNLLFYYLFLLNNT